MIALVVFNSNQNDVAYICQATFAPDLTHSEKVNMLRPVIRMLFKERIALIRAWLFHTNVINIEEIFIFNEAGYIHLKRCIGLVWKELDHIELKSESFILSRIAT